MTVPAAPFGRETIESIIPHRSPFLLVDEVLELEPGRKVLGRFRVPEDGWWFQGHFPGRPVMPGVLTIEAIELACEFERVRGPIAKGQGRATVDGDVAAEAMLTVFVGSDPG